MILTGLATRVVAYQYYNSALADGAEYIITKNALVTVQGGSGTTAQQLRIYAEGVGWQPALSGPAYPVLVAVAANKLLVRNGSGGPCVLVMCGVYYT